MQINGFYSDCNFRYFSWFYLFELHCAFLFFYFAFRFIILLALLECAWGVSPLRRRFKWATRPLKNPLASWAQLDQLMGALLLLCKAAAAAAIFGFALSWARLNKKIQNPHKTLFYQLYYRYFNIL